MKNKDHYYYEPWIGVDLDRTLAFYDGFIDELHIGRPILEMVEKVKAAIEAGYKVKIFTARVSEIPGRDISAIQKAIEDWSEEHIGTRLEVTNIKDMGCIEIWDDIAKSVIPNEGKFWE